MSLLNEHLFIQKSTLPVSGDGVFTQVDIARGEKITELIGDIITMEEYENLPESEDGYQFVVDDKKVIDLYYYKGEPGRYINDAKGLVRVMGVANNCEFQVIDRRVFVVALRNIKAGSELFVDYGREYWRAVRSRYKLNGVPVNVTLGCI